MTWHCDEHGEVIPQATGTSYRCPKCTGRVIDKPEQSAMVSVPRELLHELASDLEAELTHEHIDHPVTNRRLDRDMEPVRRAKAILEAEQAGEDT